MGVSVYKNVHCDRCERLARLLHLPFLSRGHSLVPTSIAHASSRDVVHTCVIDVFAAQKRSAISLIPEDRPIHPEILAVTEQTSRKRIGLLVPRPCLLVFVDSIALESDGVEGVETKEFTPLG